MQRQQFFLASFGCRQSTTVRLAAQRSCRNHCRDKRIPFVTRSPIIIPSLSGRDHSAHLERNPFQIESIAQSKILVEHDLFGKPASTPGSSPRAGFFRIML
jgi:hypothetical protein